MVCQAQLKLAACVADIDYQQPGNINKRQSQIAQMAQSDWLDRDQNRLITGPCGRRKTYLACAVTTACHG